VLTCRTGCRKCCHLVTKRSPSFPFPTAAQHDAAATGAAPTPVTRRTDALTPIVGSAAGTARGPSHGFAADFRTITGLTVDAYRQTGHHLGDPTAWV
jgi:hypothetical protein